jgi:hypothetical protein
LDWIYLAQDTVQWLTVGDTAMVNLYAQAPTKKNRVIS